LISIEQTGDDGPCALSNSHAAPTYGQYSKPFPPAIEYVPDNGIHPPNPPQAPDGVE
jgi:hypothetical protein